MSESPDTNIVCSPHKILKKDNLENIADETQQTEPQAKLNAVCNICQRKYAKFYNLYKHQRKCHPDDSNTLQFKLSKAKKYACNLCPKAYTRKHALSQHEINAHMTDVSQQLEDATSVIYPRKYICDMCGKKMSSNYNLKIHQQKIHGLFQSTFSTSLKCSLCLCSFSSKESFIDHLAEIHNLEISVESLEIKSMEEFEDWKLKMEKETTSKYICKKKYRTKNDLLTYLYSCHRNGRYIKRGSGKRHLKTGGSIKSEYFCPSSIFMQAKSSETPFPARIKFISTHLGHTCEIRKSGLSNPEKAEQILSAIIEEFAKEENFQEEAKNITMGFVGKLDLYSSPEQCAEINKTIAMLTHKCDSLATKNQR